MADCECAPPAEAPEPTCNLPVVPPGVIQQQVSPCPPQPMLSALPCCHYNVPVVPPCSGEPAPKPRRKCRYIQPLRPKSFKPDTPYRPPASKMEDNTIYRKSYLPVDGDQKPDIIMPDNHLCLGTGKMSANTVNKMSYQGHMNPLPACPILPCDHKLIGDGPVQDITTQKHDYVPKPYSRAPLIPPSPSLFPSDCPLSDATTNKLSYMPVDIKKAHVGPIYPTNAIPKATGKFADNTVQKLSYLPWETQQPLDMPWARKPHFAPPTSKMQDDTVQKLSYGPPGTYIECDDGPDCIDCPDNFCPQPPAHSPTNCCQQCCCPKASC